MRPYEQFGPFLLAFPLGRGGMGEVYAARTPWPGRPIAAVKRLRQDVATTPTYAERFAHEAELAVRLAHPNIVDTIDVGAVDGRLYIASELILGKSVGAIADHLLMQRQGAPTAIVIRILLDVLAGLAYGHAATDRDGRWLRLVHRDVTPGNVLVGYDGIARLTDFGLAKSQLGDENLTQTGAIVGTPSYIAPELIRAERPTPAADIYSLGAVAYRFLTGIPPFEGTKNEIMTRALTQRPRSVMEIRPDLPVWFVNFVNDMLEPTTQKRPGDARILASELEREARSHDLLIEASWVDLWMGTYFEKARQQALIDAQAVAAIDPILPNMVVERTQSFARSDLLSQVIERVRDPSLASSAFADEKTRVFRDDLTTRDHFDAGFSEDTDQGAHIQVDDLRLTPQPSRAESGSVLRGVLESGALVSPVESDLAHTDDVPQHDSSGSATVQLAPITVSRALAGPTVIRPANPPAVTKTSIKARRTRRRPLLVAGTLCLALAVLIVGLLTLLPSRAEKDARQRAITRLDAVRARVDHKIERREPIAPAAVRLLADSTRALVAADYLRADILLGDLERTLDAAGTSTSSLGINPPR